MTAGITDNLEKEAEDISHQQRKGRESDEQNTHLRKWFRRHCVALR